MAESLAAHVAAFEPSFHARQLHEVAQAFVAGRPPLVAGDEGRQSLEILLAIYESQRTGLPVRLPLRRQWSVVSCRQREFRGAPAPVPAELTADHL